MGILGAVAGAVGGASQGFAPAMGNVMRQKQQQSQFDATAGATADYRGSVLAQGEARQAELVKQGSYERAYQESRGKTDQYRAETDRIRASTAAANANRVTRLDDDPVKEYDAARGARALAAAKALEGITDPDERYRIIKNYGFDNEEHLSAWNSMQGHEYEQGLPGLEGGSEMDRWYRDEARPLMQGGGLPGLPRNDGGADLDSEIERLRQQHADSTGR